MFKSILVATDLSEASDHVVGCLAALRALGTERVILIHCLGIKHIQSVQHMLAPLVEPKLQSQKEVLEKQGYEVNIEIAPGLPQYEIDRVAAQKGCSLVIVGSHGHTMSSEIRLGGVASELIHNAKKPMLLVRLKVEDAKDRTRCEAICGNLMEHILYPTDFSDNAEHAFAYVKELVLKGAKRVTLLHVQDKIRIEKHLEHRLEEFNRIDQERLERLKSDLIQLGGEKVETAIVYGMPVPEILKKSKDKGVTLIIMGSQGRGYISELFLGSVSHNVSRKAELPVLLIPALRKP